MLRRLRLITLLVVQHGLLLNEFEFSRAVRQKGGHERTILITPVAALLSVLSIAAQPGQVVRNIQVSDGPTPFIRFVRTSVSDVAGFGFAQFLILPKTGSATRPIRVRYARSYLEARGYFDPQTGPKLGLYPLEKLCRSYHAHQLLLFDDGAGTNYQQPPGETRTYSAPRKYQIDLGAFQATETWHYYPDPSIYSPFCSSVYEDAPNNYLIDYTLAGPYTYTGIVGLDALGNVAFNYQYDELNFCGTAWNAIQIHRENLNLE
jgi:hypothetical protein